MIDILPHQIGSSLKLMHIIWVFWSCYVTRASYSIFSENYLLQVYELHEYTNSNIKEVMHFSGNQNLTIMTPNDPRLTFDPIT